MTEDAAVLELAGVAVVDRVYLDDVRREVAGELGHTRLLVVAHRDDDLLGMQRPIACRHHEPAFVP